VRRSASTSATVARHQTRTCSWTQQFTEIDARVVHRWTIADGRVHRMDIEE